MRKLLSGGVQQVRVVLRAFALLQLAKGASAPQIAGMVPLTAQAIRKIGHRYQEGGLERALYERQRPGRRGCSKTARNSGLSPWSAAIRPKARARWTVRLVAEEAVKTQIGAARGKGNHSHSAAQPRPQAVAGKKCGAWPNSMTTTSPRWKTFWKSTSGLMIRRSR